MTADRLDPTPADSPHGPQPLRSAESPGGRDRGSATVLALALATVLLCAGGVGLALAQLAAARERTDAAADLAALAAAERVLIGPQASCDRAAELALRHHVELDGCEVQDIEVVVRVSLPAPPLVARAARAVGVDPPRVRAAARAGPLLLDDALPPQ